MSRKLAPVPTTYMCLLELLHASKCRKLSLFSHYNLGLKAPVFPFISNTHYLNIYHFLHHCVRGK